MATPGLARNCEVAVRVKPEDKEHPVDSEVPTTRAIEWDEADNVVTVPHSQQKYQFDAVFGPEVSQEVVYSRCCSPLVEFFFKGYNCCILAYGQTGSGKTFTMGSSVQEQVSATSRGILPRAAEEIFHIVGTRKAEGTPVDFNVTFVEVYNEELRDLMDDAPAMPAAGAKPIQGKAIRITEDHLTKAISVLGVKRVPVHNKNQLLACLVQGAMLRMTASNSVNANSSRSHAIFTLTMSSGSGNDFVTSKFHFVDLAGSERIKRTRAEGHRLKEGISINTGLLALSNVINMLSSEAYRLQPLNQHVPYRDSKLTRILQDSLGGNSRTVMIACVASSSHVRSETWNTIKYAARARNIQNIPVVNRSPHAALVESYQRQIDALTSQVVFLKRREVAFSVNSKRRKLNAEKLKKKIRRKTLRERQLRELCGLLCTTQPATSLLPGLESQHASSLQMSSTYEKPFESQKENFFCVAFNSLNDWIKNHPCSSDSSSDSFNSCSDKTIDDFVDKSGNGESFSCSVAENEPRKSNKQAPLDTEFGTSSCENIEHSDFLKAASGTDLNGGKHGGIERARSVSDRHNDVSGSGDLLRAAGSEHNRLESADVSSQPWFKSDSKKGSLQKKCSNTRVTELVRQLERVSRQKTEAEREVAVLQRTLRTMQINHQKAQQQVQARDARYQQLLLKQKSLIERSKNKEAQRVTELRQKEMANRRRLKDVQRLSSPDNDHSIFPTVVDSSKCFKEWKRRGHKIKNFPAFSLISEIEPKHEPDVNAPDTLASGNYCCVELHRSFGEKDISKTVACQNLLPYISQQHVYDSLASLFHQWLCYRLAPHPLRRLKRRAVSPSAVGSDKGIEIFFEKLLCIAASCITSTKHVLARGMICEQSRNCSCCLLPKTFCRRRHLILRPISMFASMQLRHALQQRSSVVFYIRQRQRRSRSHYQQSSPVFPNASVFSGSYEHTEAEELRLPLTLRDGCCFEDSNSTRQAHTATENDAEESGCCVGSLSKFEASSRRTGEDNQHVLPQPKRRHQDPEQQREPAQVESTSCLATSQTCPIGPLNHCSSQLFFCNETNTHTVTVDGVRFICNYHSPKEDFLSKKKSTSRPKSLPLPSIHCNSQSSFCHRSLSYDALAHKDTKLTHHLQPIRTRCCSRHSSSSDADKSDAPAELHQQHLPEHEERRKRGHCTRDNHKSAPSFSSCPPSDASKTSNLLSSTVPLKQSLGSHCDDKFAHSHAGSTATATTELPLTTTSSSAEDEAQYCVAALTLCAAKQPNSGIMQPNVSEVVPFQFADPPVKIESSFVRSDQLRYISSLCLDVPSDCDNEVSPSVILATAAAGIEAWDIATSFPAVSHQTASPLVHKPLWSLSAQNARHIRPVEAGTTYVASFGTHLGLIDARTAKVELLWPYAFHSSSPLRHTENPTSHKITSVVTRSPLFSKVIGAAGTDCAVRLYDLRHPASVEPLCKVATVVEQSSLSFASSRLRNFATYQPSPLVDLIAGGTDGVPRLWDNGWCMLVPRHASAISGLETLRTTTDASVLISCSLDASIRLWTPAESGAPLLCNASSLYLPSPIRCVSFTRKPDPMDGSFFGTAGLDSGDLFVMKLSLPSGKESCDQKPPFAVACVIPSADGTKDPHWKPVCAGDLTSASARETTVKGVCSSPIVAVTTSKPFIFSAVEGKGGIFLHHVTSSSC